MDLEVLATVQVEPVVQVTVQVVPVVPETVQEVQMVPVVQVAHPAAAMAQLVHKMELLDLMNPHSKKMEEKNHLEFMMFRLHIVKTQIKMIHNHAIN